MGYMDDGVFCSDKVRIMPEGKIYHFGVLQSNVHMSWVRAICCRLKSDYSVTLLTTSTTISLGRNQLRSRERELNRLHRKSWTPEHFIRMHLLLTFMIL